MRITITLRASDPPEGDMAVEGEAPVPFEGWMGLLSVLWERVSPRSAGTPSQGAHQLEA
jgi:hypothetical protein